MSTDDHLTRLTAQLRKPVRVGAAVASLLRQAIIDGEFEDGDLLPKEDDLLANFDVSRQSLRDAMRILETEGLVTVRRGNAGGAVVHSPKPDSAAYMLSLVLANRGTTVADLALALAALEPTCAAMCAEREDRAESVLPFLTENLDELSGLVDEEEVFTAAARRFHQAIVDRCGSATLALMIGTLETLWSAQAARWAAIVSSENRYPGAANRKAVLKVHARIVSAISAGDAERARVAVRRHLHETQRFVLESGREQLITSLDLRRDAVRDPRRVIAGDAGSRRTGRASRRKLPSSV
jgi:GntR family transcriptional regulator, transcriptional repressor for pyruvate dehydrogenase complex